MSLHDFAIEVTEQHDRTTVSVSGDIDFDTCLSLKGVLDALELTGRTLILDLSAVSFMGTSFLHVLIALRHRAIEEEWTLELSGVPDQGLRVLDLTDARHLFTLRSCLTP
ncbi:MULTISPECIES: STAS domain-containing protein [unclassified Streptomyces]|uniref:STAS domain-containing protein n=1 Tax=unclassified Streptomyces TaxID=2593676 RepID=UPI0038008E72